VIDIGLRHLPSKRSPLVKILALTDSSRFAPPHAQIHASLQVLNLEITMKKLIPLLISGIIVVGAFGCQEAPKNSSENPSTTNETSSVPASPAAETTQTTDKIPLPTPNADSKQIPITETTTPPATKVVDDLKTEVSAKLQEGLPDNKLQVQAEGNEIILKGTASSKVELKKAKTLVKQVKGVKTVKVEAKVEPGKQP
jgi:hypothetical protein